jgi:hypothetical protein
MLGYREEEYNFRAAKKCAQLLACSSSCGIKQLQYMVSIADAPDFYSIIGC